MNLLIMSLFVSSTLICLIIFIITVIQYDIYTTVIPNRIINETLDLNIPKGYKIKVSETLLNRHIYIYIGEMPFITNVDLPIFYKYYVNNVGMVFRFSSAHKRIAKIERELFLNKMKKN